MENEMTAPEQQSAWNLSQFLIQQIGVLLQSASSNYTRGDIRSSYFNTSEVVTLIYADLHDDERKKLKVLDIGIGKLANTYLKLEKAASEAGKTDNSEEELCKLSKNKHAHAVREFRLYVMQLLSKYGYMVSKREDSSRLL